MYTVKNYRTKKELITDVQEGKQVEVYQPGAVFPTQENGQIVIEGPHNPEPHRWYAGATIENRIIVKIK